MNPDAEERCNDVDDDCDGLVDADDPDVVDALDLFVDDDRDGWGGEPLVRCAPLASLVDVGGDCDDDDPDVNPDAPEIWAQVVWARDNEWAETTDDVLRRRTTLTIRGLDDRGGSIARVISREWESIASCTSSDARTRR